MLPCASNRHRCRRNVDSDAQRQVAANSTRRIPLSEASRSFADIHLAQRRLQPRPRASIRH